MNKFLSGKFFILSTLIVLIAPALSASCAKHHSTDPCVDESAYAHGKKTSKGWGAFASKADAVTSVGRHVYFFSGDKYRRYDTYKDKFDQKALSISKYWHGLKNFSEKSGDKLDFTKDFDAVFYYPKWKVVYFFKGKYYMSYNYKKNHAISKYPEPISHWKGIPKEGNFDSIMFTPDVPPFGGKKTPVVYFFKDKQYWRYSMKKAKVDQKPYPIFGHWNHLEKGADAAFYTKDVIKWNSHKTPVMYFFYKDDKYFRNSATKHCKK